MITITYDFESFWSQTHTLTKMGAIEYVMHPGTEIQSISIKIGDGPTRCVFGEERIRKLVQRIDWSDAIAVAHNNSEFDAMILAWRFGVKPKMWGCTLAMARPIYAKTVGGSLKALAAEIVPELGAKGSLEETNTRGKRLADFTKTELAAMEWYNNQDTELCYGLFKSLLPRTSSEEMRLIDMTIRMLVEPAFELDTALLRNTLKSERTRKTEMLVDLALKLQPDGYVADALTMGMSVETVVTAKLASQKQFAELLVTLGVEVPKKPSPTDPLKYIPALAKTDQGFIDLQEHDNELVAAAARARLGVKSTLLETRIEKFLSAASHLNGKLPVPLRYCGADTTGRWSGWAYNPQNLPRINPDTPKAADALRKSLRAPKGYKVVVADLSGIELRVNMFLWKVPYAMKMFQDSPDKADLYKALAAQIFSVKYDDVTKPQRQMGKVLHLGCFGANTRVLTANGIKRIVDVSVMDKVWDGKSWVSHSGLIHQGVKPTIHFQGVVATSDHEILTERGWVEWSEVCERTHLFQSALRSASSPCLSGSLGEPHVVQRGGTQLFGAHAGGRVLLTATTLYRGLLQGVTSALRKNPRRPGSGTGSTPMLYRMTGTEAASSIGFQPPLLGAIAPGTSTTPTTGAEASMSARCGAVTGPSFCDTLLGLLDGITRHLTWTASTTTAGMNQGTSGSSAESRTQTTSGPCGNSRNASKNSSANLPVYDLLNCGPNNRFTVVTDSGPILVHNCGFGVGGAKFKDVAKLMGGVELSETEAKNLVGEYRNAHPEIVNGWKRCHESLGWMYEGMAKGPAIDPWGLCYPTEGGILTPKGVIRYPHLRQVTDEESGKQEWAYGEGRHKTRIYAGKVTENIVQHLARSVIADNALQVKAETKYVPKLMVHDELVYIVPDSEAEDMLDVVQSAMRTPPEWWPELITWSEGDIADTYGDAK